MTDRDVAQRAVTVLDIAMLEGELLAPAVHHIHEQDGCTELAMAMLVAVTLLRRIGDAMHNAYAPPGEPHVLKTMRDHYADELRKAVLGKRV
jgi:hypothetical protein